MQSSKWLKLTNFLKLLTLLTYCIITVVVETETEWVIYQILDRCGMFYKVAIYFEVCETNLVLRRVIAF